MWKNIWLHGQFLTQHSIFDPNLRGRKKVHKYTRKQHNSVQVPNAKQTSYSNALTLFFFSPHRDVLFFSSKKTPKNFIISAQVNFFLWNHVQIFTLKIVNNSILVHCQGLWTWTCLEFWCNHRKKQQHAYRLQYFDVHMLIFDIGFALRYDESKQIMLQVRLINNLPARSVGGPCGCAPKRMHLIEFHHPKMRSSLYL